ncbi:MAG: hypothetical protein LUD72_01915 [Bacteroidales bacterium]|nr:hypothetical protein [Bacteroidales bacterium]
MYFAAKKQKATDAARDEFVKYATSRGCEIETYGAECFEGNVVPDGVKRLSGQSVLIIQTGGYVLFGRGYYEETEDTKRPTITVGKGEKVSIHIWPSTISEIYVAEAKKHTKKQKKTRGEVMADDYVNEDKATLMVEEFLRDISKRDSDVRIFSDQLRRDKIPDEVKEIYNSNVCAIIKGDGNRWKILKGKASYDFLSAEYAGDEDLPGLWIDTGSPIITKAYLKDIELIYAETPKEMSLDEVENFTCDNLAAAFAEAIKPGTPDSSVNEPLPMIERLLEENVTEKLLSGWDADKIYAFARNNFYELKKDLKNFPYCEDPDYADRLGDPTLLDAETAAELCAARIYRTVQTITKEWEASGRKADFFAEEKGRYRMPPRKVEGDPLKFRPRTISEPIPDVVYEARLSRLPDDARYFLERDFKENDKKHTDKYLYFGGLTQDSWERNAALLAVRCADIAYGNEEMAKNIFASSGFGDNIKEEYLAPLVHEAVIFRERFGKEGVIMHEKGLRDLGDGISAK